jgi:altronate dehydratase
MTYSSTVSANRSDKIKHKILYEMNWMKKHLHGDQRQILPNVTEGKRFGQTP